MPFGAPATDSTGLPAALKAGVEALSGVSLDAVRVHRASAEPARHNAEAFARGSDIHLAPGRDHHLPHEAWHVVQQVRGRVRATARDGDVAINDDPALEAEARTMGARATAGAARLSVSPALMPITPRDAATAPAQFAGHIRFANLSTKQKYATKAQAIIDGLRDTPSIANFIANKDVLITLKFDSQLATVGVRSDQVQITLSPWFFEQESRGRILGMLAHEFGVHPVATEALGQIPAPPPLVGHPPLLAPLAQEQHDIQQDTPFPTGVANLNIVPSQAGQMDHVFAMTAGQPRFAVYQRTVHEMARGLYARVHGAAPGGRTDAHVTDLIMTYLADIAMVLATNDHRDRVYGESANTAAIFNLERARWLQMLGNGDAVDQQLVALTPPAKTGDDVRSEVRGTVGSFMLSMFTSSTSSDKYDHTRAHGALSETSTIQAEVLGDHALALVPLAGANTDTLFEAIQAGGGPAHSRTLARAHLNGLQDQTLYNLINNTQHFRAELDWGGLNEIAEGVGRTLRILKPDGKFLVSNNHGALVTLVWVKQPNPHYRAAQ